MTGGSIGPMTSAPPVASLEVLRLLLSLLARRQDTAACTELGFLGMYFDEPVDVSCRNLIKKPLASYWLLNKSATIWGSSNKGVLNQVPALCRVLWGMTLPLEGSWILDLHSSKFTWELRGALFVRLLSTI